MSLPDTAEYWDDVNGFVYGKLGIKMCYLIEPHKSKLTAQIFKLERHPQFAIYIVIGRFYS